MDLQAEAAARRRNWLAVALATIPLYFSYLMLAVAVSPEVEGEPATLDSGLFGLALATAPFAFVALAFLSRHPRAPRAVLRAMAVYLIVGLPLGLVTPVFGASAGFAAGGVIALRPMEYRELYKVRIIAAAAGSLYVLVLVFTITSAGVFTGGVLPFIAIGLADEYSAWRAEKEAADQ
jgi:hypothetical protein